MNRSKTASAEKKKTAPAGKTAKNARRKPSAFTPDLPEISRRLFEAYPDLKCALEFKNAYELLVAARLSAQCTDKRVNIVCADLFARWGDFEALGNADLSEVEQVVRPCGLYRVKARDIVETAKILTGRPVPDTLDGFLELPGVGRKIANLLMGELYGAPGVVVADTHCIRLSCRLGFADAADPLKVETVLRKILPPENSMLFCHALVRHGREVCHSRSPECEKCFLNTLCREYTRNQAKEQAKE